MNNNTEINLILDTTINGIQSDTIKLLSSALAIPTISTSFGDSRSRNKFWNNLSRKQNYLLKVFINLYFITTQLSNTKVCM